ncbi:uncharacterized protein RJT20DRAFT_127169 [Scheffersomyces xylosifermentans]|uniref:uncharacterized protein n=1 Tax=Scheffersomyces xylosifermentans TaxID=1304137 RepID=UPI00315CC411
MLSLRQLGVASHGTRCSRTAGAILRFQRYNSGKKGGSNESPDNNSENGKGIDQKGQKSQNNPNSPNEETNKSTDLTADSNSSDVDQYKFNAKSSSSAPAPIDPQATGLDQLIKKDNKPYIPKLKHERVSFEYPGLPNEDEFTKIQKPKTVTRWSRYVPKILTAIAVAWGAYTVKVWVYQPETGADSKELLDPSEFHKFIVTHKEEIDDDHYLIEIAPKYTRWQYSYNLNYESKSIWNGDRIWSVDIKQPEIMVVRAYTPLPLYFLKSEYTRSGERKPLLKVINNDAEDYDKQGVMCLYIKKYNDGEVSRYVTNKAIGDEIELRGPNIEYKFPYHPLKQFHQRPIMRDIPSKIEPEHLLEKTLKINGLPPFDNLNFFAAGTGIAPILQVLLSRNPYRGFVDIHYSAQKPGEIQPFERLLFFLEKLDRIKMHYHYDSDKKSILSKKDIIKPEPSAYLSPLRLEEKESKMSPEDALKLRMEILKGNDSTPASKSSSAEAEGDSEERVPRYGSAIQQALATSHLPKRPASVSLVCGPEGYITYVAGAKDLNNNAQGPVGGLLGDKNWDSSNVYKL